MGTRHFRSTPEEPKAPRRRTDWLAFLYLMIAAGLIAGTPALAQVCPDPPPPSQPDIVYIMLDDLGYGSLSSYGSAAISTPEIDDFADTACRLTQFYMSAAICSPSRVSVLTGQDPRTYNVRGALANGTHGLPLEEFSDVGIPEYVYTLPKMLQQANYRTVHVGKWHIGGVDKLAEEVASTGEFTPTALGFDEWTVRVPSKSFSGRNQAYWHEWVRDQDSLGECINCASGTCADDCAFVPDPDTTNYTHLTKYFIDEAIAAVQESALGTKPLFLNLWLRAPHGPYIAPITDPDDEDWEKYRDLVQYADTQIGRLLNEIDNELGADTIVLITSDNGAQLAGSNIGDISPNGQLVGGKGQFSEGGIRVPMIVRWPGAACTGMDLSFPATAFDLLPTLAAKVGCEISHEALLGQDLLPVLEADVGTPQPAMERDRPIFHEGGANTFAAVVRDGRWKYHRQPNKDTGIASDSVTDMSTCGGGICSETPTTNEVVKERLRDLFFDWRERTTEVHWSHDSLVGAVTARGQVYELGPSNPGQFTACSHPSDCNLPDARVNFHDRAFIASLKVRPNATFGSPAERAWLVGKDGSWNLTLTDDGHAQVEVFLEVTDQPVQSFTLESAEPLLLDEWNHLLVSIGPRQDQILGEPRTRGADLFLNGDLDSFDCKDHQTDPAQDVPPYCSAYHAVISNQNPVVVGASNSGLALAQPFFGEITDLRMFTSEHYSDVQGGPGMLPVSEQRDRLRRQEIDVEPVDNAAAATVVFEGDVMEFGAAGGQVTLCAPDSVGTCSTQHPILDPTAARWTFSASVRPGISAATGQRLIAAKNDAWRLFHFPDGRLKLLILAGCSTCAFETSAGLLPTDRWTHLALVFDRDSSGDLEAELFIDGSSQGLWSPGGMDLSGSKPFILGARGAGGSSFVEQFTGQIADVRLFFDALDDASVARLGRNEVPWQTFQLHGEATEDRGVFFFPRLTVDDQVELCGPDHPFTPQPSCPKGIYPRFNVANGPFTLTLDVRPDLGSTTGFARLVAKDASWQLHLDPNGDLSLKVFLASGATVTVPGPHVPEGVWTTVGFRLDPDLDLATVYRVIAGAEDSPESRPLTDAVGFNDQKSVVLGSHFKTKLFKGALKNLRMYSQIVDPNDARLLPIR